MTVDKWDQRQLCSDGACIGVIGPDGTCKMCGRAAPNWGDERKRGLVASVDDDESDDDDHDDEHDDDQPAAVGATSVPVNAPKRGDWNERQLCSDGTCIGVIGSDGTCKLCGRAADGAKPAPADHDDYDDDDELDDDELDDPAALVGGDDHDDGDDDEDDEDDPDDDDEDDDDFEDEDGDGIDDRDQVDRSPAGASPAPAVDDDPLAARKLCPDGACVGVIGADDKCKICGKAAA